MKKKDLEKDDFLMGLFPPRPIKVWVGVEFPNGMKHNKLSRLVLGNGDDEIHLDIKFPKEITNEIRKQVCDEIRQAFNKEDFWLYADNNKIISIHEDEFNEILDQVEKGE